MRKPHVFDACGSHVHLCQTKQIKQLFDEQRPHKGLTKGGKISPGAEKFCLPKFVFALSTLCSSKGPLHGVV
jgi:hypothetical protein